MESKAEFPKISRRTALRLGLYSLPFMAVLDGFAIEPEWVKVRRLRLNDQASLRLLHFTDLHYKGDRKFAEKLVAKINRLEPDLICFTGDIMEQSSYLPEALELLGQIKSPLYGVPGNHEFWSGADFTQIEPVFKATGGAWLMDQKALFKDQLTIYGSSGMDTAFIPQADTDKRLLLTHFPAAVDHLDGKKFALTLAGHSHGGQVRIPFWGALIVPHDVGPYQRGLYETPAGPLYVNPGIGTWMIPVRFCCRPELTLIEI